MKWYIIFSGDNRFRVLKTIFTTYQKAWNIANEMANKQNKDFEHYDILGGFELKEEMEEEIKLQSARQPIFFQKN